MVHKLTSLEKGGIDFKIIPISRLANKDVFRFNFVGLTTKKKINVI